MYNVNEKIICPYCQEKGQVVTWPVNVKTGISGGKVMGGLLTGGLSLLGTGLSNKQLMTQCYCGNCKSIWKF